MPNPIQLLQSGRPREALALLYPMLDATGGADPAVWVNICLAHEDLGEPADREKAEMGYRHVLSVWPDHVEAASNLANLLVRTGRTDEAETWQRKLVERSGGADGYARNALAHTLVEQFRIDEAVEYFKGSYEYLGYSLNVGYDRQAHRDWMVENGCRSRKIFRRERGEGEKIRVGFSGNVFREHACAFCLVPVLHYLDRTKISPVIYADNAQHDATSERLKTLAHWYDTGGLSAEAWAYQIREDGVDVLVDLMGHKRGSRVAAICRDELPMVVTYLGYPGETPGLNVDDCGWAYRPDPDAPPMTRPPFESNGSGGVTFGSFNRPAKITREVQRLWGRLLSEMPTARLVMTALGGERNTRARAELEANGVDGRRLELIDHPPTRAGYLALSDRIDVHLDPWPYNGGATTFDMLWMGVPTVTRRSVFQIGERIASMCGLLGMIANDDEGYIAIAKRTPLVRRRLRRRILGLGPQVARQLEARLLNVANSRPAGGGGCCGE